MLTQTDDAAYYFSSLSLNTCEQVGPKYVLRLLLFSAFGLSLGYDHADSSEAHALVESESRLKSRCIFMDEMHSRKEDFFLVCSNSVTSNRGILAESKEGLTIRAVILDIYHSVSQSSANCDIKISFFFS